jgi:hypothetical protein
MAASLCALGISGCSDLVGTSDGVMVRYAIPPQLVKEAGIADRSKLVEAAKPKAVPDPKELPKVQVHP